MNFKNITNLNKRQFDKILEKEGQIVRDYYNDKEYKVFFRKASRTSRSASPASSVRIFYPQDAGLTIGSTIVIKNAPYIIFSQDADESDVYYTSIANKCDTTLYSVVNNKSVEIPVTLVQDKYTLTRGTIVSVTGSVIVYGQDNIYSRAIAVNDGFNKFGNYYKVGNKFINSGICYIYMQQDVAPAGEYTVDYSGNIAFEISEQSYQMNFVAKYAGIAIDPQPEMAYESSNTSVATIDNTGLLSFIGLGSTTITCTDLEHDVMEFVDITVSNVVSDHTYEVTALNNIWRFNSGGTEYKNFTLHSYNGSGTEDTDSYLLDGTHTISFNAGEYESYVTWSNRASDNIKRGILAYDLDLHGVTIRVTAYVDGDPVAYIDMLAQRL